MYILTYKYSVIYAVTSNYNIEFFYTISIALHIFILLIIE